VTTIGTDYPDDPAATIMNRPIRIVALMTVRNEEPYLDRCLRHLISQEVDVCVIDNESVDRTQAIAREYLGKGVIRVETIPFNGCFELEKILRNEERLAREIDADWFMHHDADEIREPPLPYRNLREAVADVDRQGYNAINFDEFVFVPTREGKDELPSDYVSEMKYYYFYEPALQRRVNLWKKGNYEVDLTSNAGHRVQFRGRRIYPESFIMRHYIALNASHMRAKYGPRRFPENELNKGWHAKRLNLTQETIYLPAQQDLVQVSADGTWNKSRPHRFHLVFPGSVTVKSKINNSLRRMIQHLMIRVRP